MSMIVRLHAEADVKCVQAELQGLGLWSQMSVSANGQPPLLIIKAHSRAVPLRQLQHVLGVAEVFQAPSEHQRVDQQANQAVCCGPVQLGGGNVPLLMAGPCSVESESQIFRTAEMVAAAGGKVLRGGAFKPRTSPYSFKGHGELALGWLSKAAKHFGLGVISEVMSEQDAEAVAAAVDVLQIGTRNMQNFSLLRVVGGLGKPVLLKRGTSATVEDWMMAGEHLLAAGAPSVIFCERGIMGFDPQTRSLLDLGVVALLKHVYGQPVVVDPSHATGRRDLIQPMTRAALAAGADGVLVETHPEPSQSRSDGPQALHEDELLELGRCFPIRLAEDSESSAPRAARLRSVP